MSFWGRGWSISASPPWWVSPRSWLPPPPRALHTKPHPPSTTLSSSGQPVWKSQKQGRGELRWNALLIYSPWRRSRGAEVLLQQIYSKWLRCASRWSCSHLTALPCWELLEQSITVNTPALLKGSWQLLKWSFRSFLCWDSLAPVRDDCTGLTLLGLILLECSILKNLQQPSPRAVAWTRLDDPKDPL